MGLPVASSSEFHGGPGIGIQNVGAAAFPRLEDEWEKLKELVVDSVSSPITKRVYNMALDEFMAWWKPPVQAMPSTAAQDGAFAFGCLLAGGLRFLGPRKIAQDFQPWFN